MGRANGQNGRLPTEQELIRGDAIQLRHPYKAASRVGDIYRLTRMAFPELPYDNVSLEAIESVVSFHVCTWITDGKACGYPSDFVVQSWEAIPPKTMFETINVKPIRKVAACKDHVEFVATYLIKDSDGIEITKMGTM